MGVPPVLSGRAGRPSHNNYQIVSYLILIPKLEIVDGSQRLRKIEEFVLGDFPLGDLEELSLLTGFRFKDIPESRQRKIKNRSIRGIVPNEHADDQARFDLFDRINTGSKVANKAEVRRGALGAFTGNRNLPRPA